MQAVDRIGRVVCHGYIASPNSKTHSCGVDLRFVNKLLDAETL